MMTDAQIRKLFLRKIQKVPNDKLKELDDFINKLEGQPDNKLKSLSYAGVWSDIDNKVFRELTENLIRNRQHNKRRINE